MIADGNLSSCQKTDGSVFHVVIITAGIWLATQAFVPKSVPALFFRNNWCYSNKHLGNVTNNIDF